MRFIAEPGDTYGDDDGCHAGVIGHPRITTESRDGSSTSTSSGADVAPSDTVVSPSLCPPSSSAVTVSDVPAYAAARTGTCRSASLRAST